MDVILIKILRYSALLLIFISGIYSSTKILRKDKSLRNKFMSGFPALISVYALSVFMYDTLKTELAIQIFLPFGIIALVTATMMIFFAMQCILKSDAWVKEKIHWIPIVAYVIIYAIVLYSIDFITVISDTDLINTQVDMIPLLFGVAFILFCLIYSLYHIYFDGIKKIQGEAKKGYTIFAIAILICLLAVALSIISQLIVDDGILDLVYYGLIAISTFLMSFSF